MSTNGQRRRPFLYTLKHRSKVVPVPGTERFDSRGGMWGMLFHNHGNPNGKRYLIRCYSIEGGLVEVERFLERFEY